MNGGDDVRWAVIRRAYETGRRSLDEICQDFSVTRNQLSYRRKRDGWMSRAAGRQKRLAAEAAASALSMPGAAAAISPADEAGPRPGEPGGIVHMCGPIIARLFWAIETELSIIEERMQDTENRTPSDSERDTRSIGALIKNLEKLTEFDGQHKSGESRGGSVADITADEADRIRRDLAARIERLNQG